MKQLKRYFTLIIIRGIVLAILLIFFGGFINKGDVTALEPDVAINQNTENSSDIDKAKNCKFRDLDGNVFELGQFKGKVIFINVWASWCMPCTFEMPSIQKLHDAFKSEDVVFLIASNENKSTVRKFYKKNNYTFPVYLIDRVLPEPFQSPAIPSTFIIDREGKIALRHVGSADWNNQSCHDFIRGLLSNLDSTKIAKPFADTGNNQDIPEMMKSQRLNMARSMVTSRLESFIKQNNLSPDVKTKLIDIRVDEQLKMTELMTGNNPSPDRIYELNKIQSDSDEKISRLLPEEIYDAYRTYKRFENEWVVLSQINKELKFHGMKLEKDQEEQLAVAMYNDRQEMMRKQSMETMQRENSGALSREEMMKRRLEYQNEISGKYIESARGILTEPQLQIFKRYFDNQIYNIERALIDRVQ